MAYNTGDRFPPQPKYYRLLDPCAYQKGYRTKTDENHAPFLSNSPRKTQAGNRVWTHAIYDTALPPKIPNCTSLMSKCPRFPYEALSKEDLEEILCRCGFNVCECYSDENVVEPDCQGLVPRRLFKGCTPSVGQKEPSSLCPCIKDTELPKVTNASPPFYDIRVAESTAFYQGCKWSRWTSKRSSKALGQSPGPADYYIERQPTQAELCLEELRSYNKRRSKQLRYIEMIQQKEIREGGPGPAKYTPNLPKYAEMKYLGPKAKRFPPNPSSELRPGPGDHWVKRDFDLPKPALKPCHVKLPEFAGFGKALRFRHRIEEGASPATYTINEKCCKFLHCQNAAFNTSAPRFKREPVEDSDDNDILPNEDELFKDDSVNQPMLCPKPTWVFKSKTIRMKPLEIKSNQQSPANLPKPKTKVVRSKQMQYTAPFHSSEARFKPWNDWLPIFGSVKTAGPCYYSLEKPRCNPAVNRGPLVRTRRFPPATFQTPAPNEYKVGGGLETVLATHNIKLKNNIENQHKFHWEPIPEPKVLSYEQRESYILNRSIQLLETESEDKEMPKEEPASKDTNKPKMLRYFLYKHSIPMI